MHSENGNFATFDTKYHMTWRSDWQSVQLMDIYSHTKFQLDEKCEEIDKYLAVLPDHH